MHTRLASFALSAPSPATGRLSAAIFFMAQRLFLGLRLEQPDLLLNLNELCPFFIVHRTKFSWPPSRIARRFGALANPSA